jgi:Uma2 family endonuclease
MAEPVRKAPHEEISLLQRWVERPDGRLELVEIPLTPEVFLDPQLEDTMVQGRPHSRVRRHLADLLERHLRSEQDVMVLEDVKHLLGSGLPGPAPDVSVVRGARDPDPELSSFDAVEQGVVPCLVIEVVSPLDARIRRTDEVDKVDLYARAGIQECLLVDPPRRATGQKFRIKGYRLGLDGRYRPMGTNPRGGLLSETTQLRFSVAPEGDRIDVFDARTGERLRSSLEEEESRKAAEREIEELRAEVERLRRSEK